MNYRVVVMEGRLNLLLEGLHENPIIITTTGFSLQARNLMDEVCSYLNIIASATAEDRERTKKLLIASLTGDGLTNVQDEVAKMLNYPSLEGFIKEVVVNANTNLSNDSTKNRDNVNN